MSSDTEVLQIIKRVGALKTEDHFVGVSGKHFASYIVKDIIFSHTAEASRIGEIFALRNQDLDIDVVVGPALGGIVLSQWTAFHLSRLKGRNIYSIYTEKAQPKGQVLRRGYGEIVAGRKVLVLEDSVRTGGTIKAVMTAVKEHGGEVAAVSVLANVTPDAVTAATFGAPFRALMDYPVASHAPADCPMCKQGVPINVHLAHGREYVERSK